LSSSTVTLPGTGTLNRVDASRYGGATTAGGGTLPFSIEQAKKLLEIERSVLSSLVGQLRTSHALDETDPELAEELGLVEKPSEGAAKDARPIEKPKLSDAARSKLLERLHKLRPSTKETPTGVLKQPTDLSASEMAQRHMLAQSLGRVRDLRRWIADQQQISDPSSTFIDFSSPLKIETSSTGRRAGQIGLMTIENRSLTPYHLYIDPSIIPARSLYTGYVVPSPIDISVLPGENASVPIIGYSLDRRRPAVPSDRPLPGFIVDEQPPPSSFSKRLKQTPADATSKFSFVGLLPGTRVPIVKVVENKNGDSKETGPKGLLRRAEMGWERRDLILDAASRVVQTCDAPEFGSDWELPATCDPGTIREMVIQGTVWVACDAPEGIEIDPDQICNDLADEATSFGPTPESEEPKLSESEREAIAEEIAREFRKLFWPEIIELGEGAKVFRRGDEEYVPKPEPMPQPKTGPAKKQKQRTCKTLPVTPTIRSWDLFGDLYRQGKIKFDVEHVRGQRTPNSLRARVLAARDMRRQLDMIIKQFGYSCPEKEAPQPHYPEFPWEQFFLEFDLCDPDNKNKDRLSDFISPDADFKAVNEWFDAMDAALGNLGAPLGPNATVSSRMAAYQHNIQRALERIATASQEFQQGIDATLTIGLSNAEAEANFWKGVGMAVSAAVGGPYGMFFTINAYVAETSLGFVLEKSGVDPAVAGVIVAVAGLCTSGSAAGMFTSAMTDTATGLTVGSFERLANLEQQRVAQAADVGAAIGFYNDSAWEAFADYIRDNYWDAENLIARLEEKRRQMKAEVDRALASLCDVYSELSQLESAAQAAWEQAKKEVDAQELEKKYLEACEQAYFDCCCKYDDGSGPDNACRFTVPAF